MRRLKIAIIALLGAGGLALFAIPANAAHHPSAHRSARCEKGDDPCRPHHKPTTTTSSTVEGCEPDGGGCEPGTSVPGSPTTVPGGTTTTTTPGGGASPTPAPGTGSG